MKQMKKIGLVGGLGPEATVLYYEGMIREAQKRFGRNYFPYLVINSVNAFEMMPMLDTKDFDRLSGWLLNHLKVLADAGAELTGIASNTPHIVFSRIESESPLPLIPIMRGPVEEAKKRKDSKVLLMGTRFAMEGGFYQKAFESSETELVIPEQNDREWIHKKIIDELIHGMIKDETRGGLFDIVRKTAERIPLDAVILGCTELPLIMKPEDSAWPLLNTTQLHIEALVREACGE